MPNGGYKTLVFKNQTEEMPRTILYRSEKIEQWFWKNIWNDPTTKALLMESVPGDNRWLDRIAVRGYPSWAREGKKRTDFRYRIRKIGRKIAANPERIDELGKKMEEYDDTEEE